MALLSFNFFACDWALDCIQPPKTKEGFCLTEDFIVRNKHVQFRVANEVLAVVEQWVAPKGHTSHPAVCGGWSRKGEDVRVKETCLSIIVLCWN